MRCGAPARRILIATEKGFGKRSETEEYRVSHRGGKGIITVKTTDKTGKMVAIREVVETDDVVIVTSGGIVIRQHASEIRLAGRNTQGVRLIRLDAGDSIADVAAVVSEEADEPTNGSTPTKGSAAGEADGLDSPENGTKTPPSQKALPKKASAKPAKAKRGKKK